MKSPILQILLISIMSSIASCSEEADVELLEIQPSVIHNEEANGLRSITIRITLTNNCPFKVVVPINNYSFYVTRDTSDSNYNYHLFSPSKLGNEFPLTKDGNPVKTEVFIISPKKSTSFDVAFAYPAVNAKEFDPIDGNYKDTEDSNAANSLKLYVMISPDGQAVMSARELEKKSMETAFIFRCFKSFTLPLE